MYGNLKGTYDEENNKLINCGLDGTASAAVTGNNTLEFAGAKATLNCEGTDTELQAIFKRRIGSNESGTVSADTTNFIGGASGVKLPGNSGGDTRLNLRQDITDGVSAKNLGFGVFNPSENAVKLRVWIYLAAGLPSSPNNAELTDSSGKSFEPGWTYVRFGFDKKIFNVQIADFSKSGVDLTFDNISIF